MIKNYQDFIKSLKTAGFSMSSGSDGIYSIISWGWNEEPPYETPVRWHNQDPETDPWEWRMRVLDERQDIAYAKLFFNKTGYITKEWYPYFLSVRRNGGCLSDEYAIGKISREAQKIYSLIELYGVLPVHAIKDLGGFGKEDKSKFDRAMIELQMKMYLTMCGRQQKLSKKGKEYSWASIVFCRTEDFFDDAVFQRAAEIPKDEAVKKITEQVFYLNPQVNTKKITKFIGMRRRQDPHL